jgi:hypothetical protein
MTFSINCKDAGDPVCNHTMYGEIEKRTIEKSQRTWDKGRNMDIQENLMIYYPKMLNG